MLEKEILEEHVPVLALIAAQLVNNPEWSLKLLDVTTSNLLVPLYRQQRDGQVDLPLAIAAGQEVIKRCPDEREDIAALAHILARADRLTESLQLIDHAIDLGPNVADYHRLRASLHERLGRFVEAEMAIHRATALLPMSTELDLDKRRIAAAVLASLRRQRDESADLKIAIVAGLELVKRCPEEVDDMVALAHLIAKEDRLEEALNWINQAIALKSAVAELYRFRASLLERMGRLMGAEESIHRARMLLPMAPELESDHTRITGAILARLRQERDTSVDMPRAVAAGQELIRRSPGEVNDVVAFAHLLAKFDRLAEALTWIEKAIDMAPDQAGSHRLRASLLERMGQYKFAHQAATCACGLDPSNPELQADAKRIRKKMLLQRIRAPFSLWSGYSKGLS